MCSEISAEKKHLFQVAIVISGNIKPYLEAATGLTETLHEGIGIRTERFLLEDVSDKQKDGFIQHITDNSFDLYIAIGPEAAQFYDSHLSSSRIPMIQTMIFQPEQKSNQKNGCGIFLNIPIPVQLHEIAMSFPMMSRIGLLYDPSNNQSFFEKACEIAPIYRIHLIPLEVESKKDIPSVLKKNWGRVDMIWLIPDRTVISETIIQYIIKESLLKNIPVIGFNRFFYESGAMLSFVFDYYDLGIQTGELALKILAGKPCPTTIPNFKSMINEKVKDKILLEEKK